jgi:protein SERAC1
MDMTKFEHRDDPGFIAVVGELRRWTKELAVLSSASGDGAARPQQQQQVGQQHRTRCT